MKSASESYRVPRRTAETSPITCKALTFALPMQIFPAGWVLVTQVGFRRLEKRVRTQTHMHTLPEIFYVSQGRMILKVYGRQFVVCAGNMIILPASVFHTFESGEPAEFYYINYISRLDQGWHRFKPKKSLRLIFFPRVMIGRSGGNMQSLFEAILNERQVARSVMESRLRKLVKLIGRGFKDGIEISADKRGKKADITAYDRRIAESIRYMRRHSSGHSDLAELCRNSLGMSVRHFSRIFKRMTGCSPREYMVQLKMKKAQSMLRNKVPAKVVAEKLGYDEVYSFYRVFHKKTGHGVLARHAALR